VRRGRRGGSASPWFGANQVPKAVQRTSRELLPTGSWWVDARDFYDEARRQLPRLLEAGGALKGFDRAEVNV
jgi:hypothetical protein